MATTHRTESSRPTTGQINERLKRTQMIRPPWRTMLHPETLHYVQTHANSIGCPEEYVCFPLLSITAALISSKACIEVTDSWHEPAMLWFGVLARKGELKTTTLKYFQSEINLLEPFLQSDIPVPADPVPGNNNTIPADRFLINEDNFDVENVKFLTENNGNSKILLTQDLTMLYDHIEVGENKLKRRRNENMLRNVYEGVTVNEESAERLSLSVAGFLHPRDAFDMVNKTSLDTVGSQVLFVHPIERDCFMDDIIPVPKYTPPLHLLFKVISDAHRRRLLYRLNPEARELAYDYLNEIIGHKKTVADDENKRFILSKACGQFCRLALACHTVTGAIKEAQNRHENSENLDVSLAKVDNQWRSSILTADSVRQARDLMNFLIDQKVILMGFVPPEETEQNTIGYDVKPGHWMSLNNTGLAAQTPGLPPTPVSQSTSPIFNNQMFTKTMHYNGLQAMTAANLGYGVPPPAHSAFSMTKSALETPLHMSRTMFKNYTENFHMLSAAAAVAQQQKEQQLEPLNLNMNMTYDLMNSQSRQRSPASESRSSQSPIATASHKHSNPKPGRVIGREENGCYQYDFSNLLPYGAKNIRSLLTSGYLEISASLVAGRHLMPPTRTPGTENRYKTEAAVAYLHKVADLGFGTIHRTNKRSYIFKKRSYDELNDDAKRILTDIQVSEQAYRKVKLSIVDADKKNPLLAQIDLSNNNTNTSNANTGSILNGLITGMTAGHPMANYVKMAAAGNHPLNHVDVNNCSRPMVVDDN